MHCFKPKYIPLMHTENPPRSFQILFTPKTTITSKLYTPYLPCACRFLSVQDVTNLTPCMPPLSITHPTMPADDRNSLAAELPESVLFSRAINECVGVGGATNSHSLSCSFFLVSLQMREECLYAWFHDCGG